MQIHLRTALFGWCLCYTTLCLAAIDWELTTNQNNNIDLTTIWDIELNVTENASMVNVHLQTIITEKTKGTVVQMTSQLINLLPGFNRLETDYFTQKRITFAQANYQQYYQEHKQLPTGVYTICTSVFVTQGNVSKRCMTQKHIHKGKLARKITTTHKKNNTNFHGNIHAHALYANRAITPYMQTELNATLTMGLVPISTRGLASTNQQGMQRISEANIFFNSSLYQSNWRAKLVKVKKSALAIPAKASIADYKKELSILENYLNDASVQADIAKLQQLHTNSGSIDSSSVRNLSSSIGKDAMQELLARKTRYADIHKRINELKLLIVQARKGAKVIATKELDIYDKRDLRKQLKSYSLYKGIHRLLYNIDALEVGDTYPHYSPLTINGVRVTGLNLTINSGALFVQATKGVLQDAWASADSLGTPESFNAQYKRNITALKAGVGWLEHGHFYLTYMQATDDTSTLTQIAPILLEDNNIFPQTQSVLGAEAKFTLAKGRMYIAAEYAQAVQVSNALLSANVNNTDSPISPPLPIGIYPIAVNGSSTADFAYITTIGWQTKERRTKLQLHHRRIGAGFNTPGIPYLQNDILRSELRFKHRNKKGNMDVQTFYRLDIDQLDSLTRQDRTYLHIIGVDAKLKLIARLPSIRLGYRFTQQQQLNTNMVNFAGHVINMSGSHKYNVGKTKQQSMIFVQGQLSNNNHNAYAINWRQNMRLAVPIQITTNVYSNIKSDVINSLGLSASGTYTYKKILDTQMGSGWYNDNLSGRFNFFAETRYRFWQNKCEAALKLDTNSYTNTTPINGYTFAAQASFRVKW